MERRRAGQGFWLGAALATSILVGATASSLADEISGTVLDAGGKPVSGVKIVAANRPDKPIAQAMTGPDGSYILSGLPDGTTYLTLDPGTARIQGSTMLASVDNQGLNVVWVVSSSTPPIATATKPAKK